MKLTNKIKLGIGRYLNKYSDREANKMIKLYYLDALNDYKIDIYDGYVLYRKSIRKLIRYRSFANMLNIDDIIIELNIRTIKGCYKIWYQNYNYNKG